MQTESVQPETIKTIAAYVAIAVPVTVALANLAKALMEWLTQRHNLQVARGQQEHQIPTHYLDRTLDPKVPLAIRHQLLRFLATPDKAGSRLTGWAKAELERVGGVVDDVNRAVAKAEERLQAAANSTEFMKLSGFWQKRSDASGRCSNRLSPPRRPQRPHALG